MMIIRKVNMKILGVPMTPENTPIETALIPYYQQVERWVSRGQVPRLSFGMVHTLESYLLTYHQ